ncbi:MAG: FAD-dependent oxidoreductase [Burkholderiaceae bacterium]|nr:FAD-dependent oxidoreductase [Burkholderiaceae bacterium]
MKGGKLVIFAVIAVAIALFFYFDLGHFFSLAYLKSSQQSFAAYYAEHPVSTLAIYFAIYVAMCALSLPGAAVVTLAGGALFGLVVGTLLVSFASTLGATLAFLSSRFLLRDWVKSKFGARLGSIDAGIAKEGSFYLFMLRIVPAVPFFVVNLLMGLTAIRMTTYMWVSQLGMLAGTIVYVNAGTQLAQIDSLRGILSLPLILSFVALGVFPLIGRKLVQTFQARRIYAKWQKPAKFDRNMIVIGGGSAGLVTSLIAAVVKAKVTLVEGHKMGGDCLNFGCVPSKALIRSAKFAKQASMAETFGMDGATVDVNFAKVMQRVHRVIKTIAPHDSVERFTGLGVEVLQGHAKITSPWSVEITTPEGKQTLTTRTIVVATGARPFVPPIKGIQEVGFETSDTIWGLTELPKRLVVLGAGPIGCELAQSFARLGSNVTQVELAPRIMVREDPEVSEIVRLSLIDDGINLMTSHQAIRCEINNGEKTLIVVKDGVEKSIPFDVLLCAVGRAARTEGFGLEELGVAISPKKTIATDEFLQTNYPNILACGDVAGPYQLTHTAAHQAWYAAVNGLFGQFKRFKVDYRVIPWTTFTEPEVARVGISETEAKEQGIAVEVTRYGLDDLDRAIADDVAHGFVKVLTPPGSDKILGVTIVGDHAGELIAEYVLAMKHNLGLKKILGTIHTYPTMAEANKYAASEWAKAHAPQGLLVWVKRYQDWRRG